MHNKFLIFKYAAIMMRCGYAKCINATAAAAVAVAASNSKKFSLVAAAFG